MNESEIVKSIMADVFKTRIENITTDLKQKDIVFWDSLRHLNLVVELEEKFAISFEPEEIAEMITFEKVLYYVNQKVEPR
jgi:acyl carrier protein